MMESYRKQLQVGSWVLVAVFVLAAVWLLQSIDQMRRAGNVSDTLTVEGQGKVLATPDVAVAELSINVEAATASLAQNQANVKSNAVVAFLKGKGIEEKDIKTSGYNIYPQYDYVNGRSVLRGYQVTQSFTVKIRDMARANEALDGVVDAGVNQVGGISFQIDDPEKLKQEARQKAIDDAKQKASVLEGQLGVDLGHIVSFSESQDGFYPQPYMMREAVGGVGGGGTAPALPTGENEVIVNVSVTYQIR